MTIAGEKRSPFARARAVRRWSYPGAVACSDALRLGSATAALRRSGAKLVRSATVPERPVAEGWQGMTRENVSQALCRSDALRLGSATAALPRRGSGTRAARAGAWK